MSKILILEDNNKTRLMIKKIIYEINDSAVVIEANKISEATKALSDNGIDLFLLDIQLDDGLGTNFALSIRKLEKYKITPIVFITAMPTCEMMSYRDIHCYEYIIKPVNVVKVKETLKVLLKYGIVKSKKNILKLNQKSIIYRIDTDDIIFLEARAKKIEINSVDGPQEISSYTIKKIMEMLPCNFVQCHRSYIVNLNYIKTIDKANFQIELNNSMQVIPIGEKYISNLRGKLI